MYLPYSSNIIIGAVIIVAFLIICILLLVKAARVSLKERESRQILNSMSKHENEELMILQNYQELMKKRHDLKHQVAYMDSLAKSKDYEELKGYIEGIIK